ncbi:MAG: pentatricopeptide repeat protein [Candidatus Omnitrophota bacterium]|jgi:pentatricopeptide repeat protein
MPKPIKKKSSLKRGPKKKITKKRSTPKKTVKKAPTPKKAAKRTPAPRISAKTARHAALNKKILKSATDKMFTPPAIANSSFQFDYRCYKPIENYGIIGNLHSVALVGTDGSIDWCCMPHIDSPSVFGAILDCNKGGFFKIAPIHTTVQKQMYLPESCVLNTRFLAKEGVAEIIDFMPINDSTRELRHPHQIIRRVKGVRGSLRFKLRCEPAFNYALNKHKIELEKKGAVFTSKKMHLGLNSPIKLKVVGNAVECEFDVRHGETYDFVLRHVKPEAVRDILVPVKGGVDAALEEVVSYWRRWVKSVKYNGRWREMVKRSAMTLKLLTFKPTGAIVAAPTTSLPEELGGVRNWDYRYTWIRDAAFTIYAFMRLELKEEAEAFMSWISERAKEERQDGSIQIMYGIHGEHELKEISLDHLEGYRGSAPVRIGNAAYSQLQLDIYGELIDSVYIYNKHTQLISHDLWQHLRAQLNYVCRNWKRKDEGIWEVRGGRQHFVYSKLMCWVALDRGIKLAHQRSFPADYMRWYAIRDEIYEEIMEKGWNEEIKSFTQYYGSKDLDASNLLMPLVFFISPNDPRMLSTIEQTLEHLSTDSLVYRYDGKKGAASDGIKGGEGTFTMCSFWMVEALTRAGRLHEARYMFEKMLSYSNHLGLYAEQIGHSGEQLGNFPQAFTHLSLISAAVNLDKALDNKPLM